MQIAQKTVRSRPREKLLDALGGILCGAKTMAQNNVTIRPDRAVQRACGRTGCAEQSTMARTLRGIVKLLRLMPSPDSRGRIVGSMLTDPVLRPPALSLSFQPNLRNGLSSLRGTPTLRADAVWVGSGGQ